MTSPLANRLHHTAYVVKDLEATRHFYEDILGFPLVATWCEQEALFGSVRTYCHCFFGLRDGSALAFFQFADPKDQAEFGPDLPSSPFRHIALNVDAEAQAELEQRIAAAGFAPPRTYVLEHGYCRSVYVVDPDEMILEFTLDAGHADKINALRASDAHDELKRWLAGDHRPNNDVRPDHLAAAH
ncbi:MAG: VOC family protein [Sphingobium phenoxybenzoativorans]|uniref:VOC family protein n=1 Tax=Sphingobium phenoxybenzoativorans TaxID=1592790 RepID=A0A975Q1P9_9SPHN|nr:VOC family protein [Sphingobium phenoxybenzoativorans]QUT06024.1 VOC family protein [Sphingobium phenoxybenzoativorans]